MKTYAITICSAILVPLVGAAPARGAVVTIAFSGELTFVQDGLALDFPIDIGTPFSGSYSFDPDGVLDTLPSDPVIGSYSFPTGSMSVSIGDNQFQSFDLLIAIWNNVPAFDSDLYHATIGPFSAYGIDWHAIGLDFESQDSGPFNSDELIASAPNLSDFGLRQTFVGRQQGLRDPRFIGVVTSIYLVPEPSAFALLVTGTIFSLRKRR